MAKKAPNGKKSQVKHRITEKSIRKRANEIYVKRMKEGILGDADSDWSQALQELRSQ